MKIVSQFETKGNIELLSQKAIAIFSSRNTPVEIYEPADNLFKKLCTLSLSIAGGWQAPLERHFLDLTHPQMEANIIFYSAKDLATLKNPKLNNLKWREKVLYLSAQSKKIRATGKDIDKRDKLMLDRVSAALFIFVEQGGRLQGYVNRLLEKSFPVFSLEHDLNRWLINSGAVGINPENASDLL